MTSGLTARVTRATAGFDPDAVAVRSALLTIEVAAAAPPGTEALGVPVATGGDVPPIIGVDRARLLESGFTGCARPDARPAARGTTGRRGGRDRRHGQHRCLGPP